MVIKHLLNYECVDRFKKEFYRPLLTANNVSSGRIHIRKLTLVGGGKTNEFWGWELEKDEIKYLLSMYEKDKDGNTIKIKIKDVLPIQPLQTQTVSYRGVVYEQIKKYDSATFASIKKMSFRQLVDTLSSLQHSNPTHQKLLWFMALAQTMDRANFRVATPPGFGKDSVVDILGKLIGDCATIETPTIAKLEYMTYCKLLAINEVMDLTKEQWRIIEDFLLKAGAFKTEVTKRSMATDKTKDILDTSHLSLLVTYNDISEYPDPDEYLDFKVKGAIKNRFAPFRLHGVYTENFNEITTIDINEFAELHKQDYKDIIYTFTYYKENMLDELHRYTYEFPAHLAKEERWKLSLRKLFQIIDLYSESQEEFNSWIEVVYEAMNDYKEMLSYPSLAKKAFAKLSPDEVDEQSVKLKSLSTYKDKNSYLRKIVSGDVDYHAEQTLDFWAAK